MKAAVASVFVIVSFATCVATAFANEAGPRIPAQQVRDGLYVLHGGDELGANVGVLKHDNGLLLIDTMEEKASAKLMSTLGAIADAAVTHVINTHNHLDHAGGNRVFLAKDAVLVRQSSDPNNGEAEQLNFDGRIALTVGGQRVELYAVRSHAPDDALVYLPGQNVLFTGDTFTTNWHPTFYAGGETGQLAMIDLALDLSDDETVIVPGHGPVATRDGLLSYRAAFLDWMLRIRQLHAQGRTVEEMVTDPQLLQISTRFLRGAASDRLPDQNFRRFIERTIGTIAAPPDKG